MDTKNKPRGREEVVAALLEAAAELFSKHGVEAVSIRDIAAQAGVNHGLIHRHFGSKEILRQKTQESLAEKIISQIGEPENFIDALLRARKELKDNDAYWRLMARTFLDGKHEGEIQSSFPFIQKLVTLAQKEQDAGNLDSEISAPHIVAGIAAFGLGMLVFEQYILSGTGLTDESMEDVQEKLISWMMSIKPK